MYYLVFCIKSIEILNCHEHVKRIVNAVSSVNLNILNNREARVFVTKYFV